MHHGCTRLRRDEQRTRYEQKPHHVWAIEMATGVKANATMLHEPPADRSWRAYRYEQHWTGQRFQSNREQKTTMIQILFWE